MAAGEAVLAGTFPQLGASGSENGECRGSALLLSAFCCLFSLGLQFVGLCCPGTGVRGTMYAATFRMSIPPLDFSGNTFKETVRSVSPR